MTSSEKSQSPDETENKFDQPRNSDLGVMCLFTYLVDGREKFVLMTVDPEDVVMKKSERMKNTIKLVMVGADMWSFPGGKVEPGEKVLEAILREIQEETGLEVDSTRLKELNAEGFEVEQVRQTEQSPAILTNFFVFGFSYQLDAAELGKMIQNLASQNRQVVTLTAPQIAMLNDDQIRPSSKGLLNIATSQ